MILRSVLMTTGLGVSFLILVTPANAHAQYFERAVHAAYGNYPHAPGRILAMGGANVGFSDDVTALVSNPAGLAISKTKYDFTSTTNSIVNKEADFFSFDGRNNDKDGFPYTTGFQGAVGKWGDFAVGAGQTTQYDLTFESGELAWTLLVQSYDLLLAYAISKNLAFGVTGHSETANLSYKDSSQSTDNSQSVSKLYFNYGVLYQASADFRLGITYSPERLYDMNEDLNGTNNLRWFNDVGVAQKTTIGIQLKSGSKLFWVFDIDFIKPVKDATYIGATVGTGVNNTLLQTEATVIHGGYEFQVKKEKDFEFIWRGGGYKEPSRILSESDRLHFTMGVEMRLWFLSISAAYDQAENFSNTAQSISVVYKAL